MAPDDIGAEKKGVPDRKTPAEALASMWVIRPGDETKAEPEPS